MSDTLSIDLASSGSEDKFYNDIIAEINKPDLSIDLKSTIARSLTDALFVPNRSDEFAQALYTLMVELLGRDIEWILSFHRLENSTDEIRELKVSLLCDAFATRPAGFWDLYKSNQDSGAQRDKDGITVVDLRIYQYLILFTEIAKHYLGDAQELVRKMLIDDANDMQVTDMMRYTSYYLLRSEDLSLVDPHAGNILILLDLNDVGVTPGIMAAFESRVTRESMGKQDYYPNYVGILDRALEVLADRIELLKVMSGIGRADHLSQLFALLTSNDEASRHARCALFKTMEAVSLDQPATLQQRVDNIFVMQCTFALSDLIRQKTPGAADTALRLAQLLQGCDYSDRKREIFFMLVMTALLCSEQIQPQREDISKLIVGFLNKITGLPAPFNSAREAMEAYAMGIDFNDEGD